MTDTAQRPADHPAPHRTHAGSTSLLLGVAAGPAGWILQLLVSYSLSSFACYPKDTPLRQAPPPGWAAEPWALLAINLCCLALPIAGLVLAWGNWRRTQDEKPGGAGTLLETGEGRTRFLASCGIMTAVGFAVGILFNTASALAVPMCWRIA